MNKKILIILISVVVVGLLGVGITMLFNNEDDKIDSNADNTNTSEHKEVEKVSNEFQFIYNMNEISDEWWNSLNEEWGDFEYTNKKVYNNKRESILGNSTGKLQVRPVGFTEYIEVGYKSITAKDDYYSLTVKNNNFLIPQQIKIIDDDVNNVSSELDFYVLGNDLEFYNVELSVDYNPTDVELINGNWKTISKNIDEIVELHSYYPINSDYCLHIVFPSTVSQEAWNNMDESTKNNYQSQYPYNEKDLEELAKNVTAIISLNKINDISNINIGAFTVQLDDIKLNENITVLMKNMNIISWHSGAKSIVGNRNAGDTVITAYSANKEWTYIAEYKEDKDLDYYLSYLNLDMKKYNYAGIDIYISYYTDDASETNRGKYHGIMFEIDGIWYGVSGIKAIDPNEINVDTWIGNICNNIISFK